MPDDREAFRRLAETLERKRTLERLTEVLKGKVLRRTDADVGGGVSGVISTSQKKRGLFLFDDGTFRLEVIEFTSVSSGGYSVPSQEKRSGTGTWAVEMADDKPALVLRQEGAVVQWWHTEEGGTGIQYLNGQRWDRYLIRE
jgi:hypothetical protein